MDTLTGNHRAICFTGHRPDMLPAPGTQEAILLSDRLNSAIDDAIASGVSSFYAGGAMGFDMLAEEAVLIRKASFPELRLILALPAPDQADHFPLAEQARYQAILSKADEIYYAATTCTSGAMLSRDRYLVEHAQYCICYLKKMNGGTYYTVRQAIKKGIPVINLAMPIESSAKKA